MKFKIVLIGLMGVALCGHVQAQVGDIFVSNCPNPITLTGGNNVYRFTPNGSGSVFGECRFGGIYGSPAGLAFDGAGTLYMADFGGDMIETFGPAGGFGSIFATTGLNGPKGLVLCHSSIDG